MSLAAKDFFVHNRSIPRTMETPQNGPLFDYLWQRQLDTFDMDNDAHYLRKFREWWSLGPAIRHLSIAEVDKLKHELDQGNPTVIGLIYIRFPKLIWKNHQVLAYGYRQSDSQTVFRIYDPNHRHSDMQEIHTEKRHRPFPPREIMKMEQHHFEKSANKEVTIKQEVKGLFVMDVPTKEPPRNL
jgi:hypothetical protein